MKEYIFTFGSGQNPGIGYFCKIKAETRKEARLIMNERTLEWAFCYNSEDEAGVKRYDLIELKWTGSEFVDIKKPFDYKKLSNKHCVDCGKRLKMNLVARYPDANRCYKHHKIYKSKIK